MVWLHGGGFSSGSGSDAILDGTNLARTHDVVVVTHQPPAERVRLHVSRRGDGIRVRAVRRRRHARHRRRARVGARQHRPLRRRSEPRDDLRPVGRRTKGGDADVDAGREGAVSSRDHRERRRAAADDEGRCGADDRPAARGAWAESGADARAAERADGRGCWRRTRRCRRRCRCASRARPRTRRRWTARRFPAIRGIRTRPALSADIPLLIGYARTEETLYDRPTPEKLALDEAGLESARVEADRRRSRRT